VRGREFESFAGRILNSVANNLPYLQHMNVALLPCMMQRWVVGHHKLVTRFDVTQHV